MIRPVFFCSCARLQHQACWLRDQSWNEVKPNQSEARSWWIVVDRVAGGEVLVGIPLLDQRPGLVGPLIER